MRIACLLTAVVPLCVSLAHSYVLPPSFASDYGVIHRSDIAEGSSFDKLTILFAGNLGGKDEHVWTAKLRDGLSRMNVVMTTEFFGRDGSLKQLYSQIVKSVTVKDSSIPGAGLGLFATRNIKAGTIVSFYPAHALGLEVNNVQIFVSDGPVDETYFRENPPAKSCYLHATDQPIFNRPSLLASVAPEMKDSPLYLDVNPGREVDPAWVSQYINDGAMVESNTEEGVSTYYKVSTSKKNCIHIPFGPSPIMATVTTKKVKKGEELFTSYGCVYWLGVYDEEGAGMTAQIQQQIKQSARDLFASMKTVSVVYANQIEAMQSAFNDIALDN